MHIHWHASSPISRSKTCASRKFSPVDERPPTTCEVVKGCLPPCLHGTYIRNGPNPQFTPHGPYHLVDGDGMLQSINISRGNVTFCSRYVKTYKYMVEHNFGHPLFPNIFSCFNRLTPPMILKVAARILTRQFNPFVNGLGSANTSLALLAGKLFALCESDLPYSIKLTSNGDIITLGRHDFHSIKPFMNMTAHPKIDLETGEAFAFRFHVFPPYLTFFRIDSNGRKQKDVPILFIHNFGVTKNYAIFPDTQIVMDPFEIMKGKSIMSVDLDKVPRLGIIPRKVEDGSEMWWIDAPGLNVLHVINAWEENDGNTISMVVSNVLSIEHALEIMDLIHFSLEKVSIHVKAKRILRHKVSTLSLDFGVINSKCAGNKNRYIYAAVIQSMPKVRGVVKIDLSLSAAVSGDCTVASRMYEPGCYGGEPIFVAREANNSWPAAEDDGYLLTYVHNENTQESHFLVMDAKSPILEIIAVVRLPRRVPYAFMQSSLNKVTLIDLI